MLQELQTMFLMLHSSTTPSHSFQPHDHQKKVAKFYHADAGLVAKAIEASLEAKKEWNKV